MAIIKAPPKQPKTAMVQVRVEEEIKRNLDRYAEFIDASPSYVVTEALKLLYRKDKDFQSWLGQHHTNNDQEQNQSKTQGGALAKTA
jgi:hypothetical protein